MSETATKRRERWHMMDAPRFARLRFDYAATTVYGSRDRAFFLAGQRSANSGKVQLVWNPETGERYSCRPWGKIVRVG